MEQMWNRFRRSRSGRLFAAAVIGAGFGAAAAAEIAPGTSAVLLSSVGGAVMGLLAVGILEWRDRARSRDADWQRRVAHTAAEIQQNYPGVPPPMVRAAAQEHEERHFSPLVWFGMVVGGFSLLCGLGMLIFRVIQYFRTP